MSEYRDEYTELLGAYALDAVDVDERERIELHLRECPFCRNEVAEHREVAAVLAHTGSDAPAGVWDRIAAELSPPAPPLRITLETAADAPAEPGIAGSAGAAVASLGDRRAVSRGRKVLVGIVAAAACIAAVLGIVAVGQSQRLNKLETALEDRSLEDLANSAQSDPVIEATLTGDGGTAKAVVDEDGQGFLIAEEMAAAPEGDVYQLWGKVDDVVLSLGTFSGSGPVVPFSVDPSRLEDVELFAVTQERAPGVLASEQQALMAGTV